MWLAHDGDLDEPVAVRLFRPELIPAARERQRREVRLGPSLQHANLVRIYELIEVGERLAIVMEWVPGGSLAERLQREGPQPISTVIEVARQVLEALAHLHARQVVHRDVKPSNLLDIRRFLRSALPDGRRSPNQVPVEDIVLSLLATVLTGGSRFSHGERIRQDEVIRGVVGVKRLASAMTLTRYVGGFVQS